MHDEAEALLGPPLLVCKAIKLDFLCVLVLVHPENLIAVFLQRLHQEESQNAAGDHFADADRQHKERNAAFKMIGIGQDERNDNGVGQDGRERAAKLANQGGLGILGLTVSDQIGPDRTKERCKASKDNVPDDTIGQPIGKNASNQESWNCSRRKKGKDGECFREADLNGVIRQTQGICQKGEYDIQGSDEPCLSDK